jgi:uncharacterized protein (DUF488 family)
VPEIFTIGHSTNSIDRFIGMLRDARISAIADVRSSPWSRHNPHFNRPDLKSSLRSERIAYRFYGKQLGGRPTDPSLFQGSTADYEAMARTSEFAEGLEMVLAGAAQHRLALMCSEHNPLDCHRCLLVGRALAERGAEVRHVLSDGKIVAQQQIEEKLLAMSGRDTDDFFVPKIERLNAAYRDRSLKVAYTEREVGPFDDDEFLDLKYG